MSGADDGTEEREEKLDLGDWLSFLESRGNTCLSILIALFALMVVAIISIIDMISSRKIDETWSIAIIVSFIAIICIYIYGWLNFGSPLKQAIRSREIVSKIINGKIKNVKQVEKRWRGK